MSDPRLRWHRPRNLIADAVLWITIVPPAAILIVSKLIEVLS